MRALAGPVDGDEAVDAASEAGDGEADAQQGAPAEAGEQEGQGE